MSNTRKRRFLGRRRPDFMLGWDSALQEIEHQADHWQTPEHGEIGLLIAEALRSACDIARAGGLACEHPRHVPD